MTAAPAIDVVVVSYDSGDDLPPLFEHLLPQLRPADTVTIVDNHGADGVAAIVGEIAPQARVLAPGTNTGFAGGTNAGVQAGDAPLVLLLNPDAVPAPGAFDALRAVAAAEPKWGAWQALVTMDGGERINTAGNVAHVLGLGWAGRCGEPVTDAPKERERCATVSGAAMVVRREVWEQLGGFDERFFMYCEDQDLSLRIRLAGWELGIEPAARVDHGYDFGKGSGKWELLERNRWWTVLSTYPARVLWPLLPLLVLFDLALLPVAAAGGWLGPKLRAQTAVIRSLPAISRRRRTVQATAAISPAAFAEALSTGLDSPYLGGAARVPGVEAALSGFWALVRPRR